MSAAQQFLPTSPLVSQPVFQVDSSGNAYGGNQDNVTLIASAALSATTVSNIQTNVNARGIVVFIAPGSFGSGASTITVKVQGYDPVSATFYDILTSASLSANTFATLTVYPGIGVTSNVSASTVLPRSWRISAQASAWGTGGSTLGVACSLII